MDQSQVFPPAPLPPKKSKKKWIAIIVILILIMVIIIGASTSSNNQSSNSSFNLIRMSGPMPNYDEQIGVAFDENFSALSYNVTAVAQTTNSGYGPAYLLNGVTNLGYWYQVGISYKWNFNISGVSYIMPDFDGIYEAFAPNGTSIFPSAKGSGSLDVKINPGDTVNLYLRFLSNDSIEFMITDFNTKSQAIKYFDAFGATDFVALGGPNPNVGFFTGIMTEEYHVHPYYGNETPVTYTAYGPAVDKVLIAIDEYNSSGSEVLFNNTSNVIDLSDYPDGYTYTYQGLMAIVTPENIITG